jgi:porin
MKKIFFCSAVLFASLIMIKHAIAAEVTGEDSVPDWKDETLTGDWGGLRSTLYRNGVDMGFTHKSDVMANVSGGIKNGTVWIGHTEARVSLDLEKLLGWNAATAYFHYHSDLGSKFNTHYVGGFMGVDNVEVARNTAQFYNAWIEKSFFKESLSIRAGLYPIDSEFYVTDTSGLFLAPPYGMSNEIAQTDTPAIFPLGALAVRAKYISPGKNLYVQAALLDGVAGDPNHPYGTHIRLGHGEGTMSIVEFGYIPQEQDSAGETGKPEAAETNKEKAETFNKTAIGFWRYTRKFDDLNATDASGNPKRRHAQGAYLLAERTLYVEKDHPSQGLAGFVRFGTATEDVHQVDWTASLGLRYHGLIAGRDDDVAGIAATVNHTSDKYQRVNSSDNTETDWEITYRAQIKPWLALQPNMQYIVNPGMDPTVENAWVVGFRTEISF